jgi:single-strand DNA-binding protein
MNNLNSILIEGNLVKDPLLRSTPKGTQVCTMRLASNRFFKLDSGYEREVTFVDVDAWARLAEACGSKGRKGRGVRVVGRIKQDRWTGADGKPHSKISIVAEHVEFRPEFRKDVKPAGEGTPDNSPLTYSGEFCDEDDDEGIVSMAEKELESVTF